MCGVIGLIYERPRADLGMVASELLRALEYRGYDSTGAAVQGEGETVQLVKGVGAPSVMVDELGIVAMKGQILCGQVRWATFGAVDDLNAQPHVVGCRAHLYGAHNGNVTNCDDLALWLASEGHEIASDNDGEMVVHTVEHYFALELDELPEGRRQAPQGRREAMRAAWRRAAARLEGSYSAVLVDPVSRTVWAVKAGSSLYLGIGESERGGAFTIASSDLSAVLRLTHVLVPLSAGELVELEPTSYRLFALEGEAGDGAGALTAIERAPVRSRLHAKDTALQPPFETFMDQEISAQEGTARALISLFLGGSPALKRLAPLIDAVTERARTELEEGLHQLRREYADDEILRCFRSLADKPALAELVAAVPAEDRALLCNGSPEHLAAALASSEAGLLADLVPTARGEDDRMAIRLLDAYLEHREVDELNRAIDDFTELAIDCLAGGGRLYAVCCGSSYHAAKAAAMFFDLIARVELIPILPGEYRGQHRHSLVPEDVLLAVSQSGETKDLIDVINDVVAMGQGVRRVAIVNNVSSTIALEKSELVIPLRCGPEIAVPATKSFMNQVVLLYCLALRLAVAILDRRELGAEARSAMEHQVSTRLDRLSRLPDLIRETFDATDADVEEAAKHLYLRPSIHILATRLTAVAKEGALKVREVVLNHTEGIEGSEFKHGPNTLLGWNTLFGPEQVDGLLKRVGEILQALVPAAMEAGLGPRSIRRLVQAVTDSTLSPTLSQVSLSGEERRLLREFLRRQSLLDELHSDYPLIYVTGPEELDVGLTISQINTHKIRGATTVVIAEDHPALRQAAVKAPANNPSYHSVYITLPRTNDTLMTVFSSTVVLQRLALKMSLLKMHYLDRLGIPDHGVHPDVPKNVSKSITVD